jgi:chemotaxis family two-component system response regulator Rcp1
MKILLITKEPAMAIKQDDTPKTVLLVEDSIGDVRLTMEAFQDANKSVRLQVVPDGIVAMAYLRREGIYAKAPRPDFILLDLNLPKMSGREVLAQIKADENLKSIPTVILTTSGAQEDIAECYKLQANSYVCKPVGFELFEELVRSINNFWMTNAMLPELMALRATEPPVLQR